MAKSTDKKSETPTPTPAGDGGIDELLVSKPPFSLKIRRRPGNQGDIFVLYRLDKAGRDCEVDKYPSIEAGLGTMEHALTVDGGLGKTLLQEYEARIKLGK